MGWHEIELIGRIIGTWNPCCTHDVGGTRYATACLSWRAVSVQLRRGAQLTDGLTHQSRDDEQPARCDDHGPPTHGQYRAVWPVHEPRQSRVSGKKLVQPT